MVHLVTDSTPAVPQKRANEITGSLKPWKAASEKHCCVCDSANAEVRRLHPDCSHRTPTRHSVKMLVLQEATDGEIRLSSLSCQRWCNSAHQSLKTVFIPQLVLWLESTRKVLWNVNTFEQPTCRKRSYTLSVFFSPSLLNYFASIYSNQAAAQIFVHALVASGIDFYNSLLWPSLTRLFWGCNMFCIQQVLQAWQHLIASLPAPFSDSQYQTWLLLWF